MMRFFFPVIFKRRIHTLLIYKHFPANGKCLLSVFSVFKIKPDNVYHIFFLHTLIKKENPPPACSISAFPPLFSMVSSRYDEKDLIRHIWLFPALLDKHPHTLRNPRIFFHPLWGSSDCRDKVPFPRLLSDSVQNRLRIAYAYQQQHR